MIVYAVESGSYSGYSVDALYTTRELAEAACALINADRYNDASVAEMTIFDTPAIWQIAYCKKTTLNNVGDVLQESKWDHATIEHGATTTNSSPTDTKVIGKTSGYVFTSGTNPADVDKQHSDAVAKRRAELIGL